MHCLALWLAEFAGVRALHVLERSQLVYDEFVGHAAGDGETVLLRTAQPHIDEQLHDLEL